MLLANHQHLCDGSYAHYLRFKERARLAAHRKVKQWNGVFGFSVESIRIKRQRTRWGSCSSNRILNFNYKLLFLSEELQDYIVIHELAHLRHMDHSRNFWALVQTACPDWHERRGTLLHYSHAIVKIHA